MRRRRTSVLLNTHTHTLPNTCTLGHPSCSTHTPYPTHAP
jgi:hypothetical protein